MCQVKSREKIAKDKTHQTAAQPASESPIPKKD